MPSGASSRRGGGPTCCARHLPGGGAERVKIDAWIGAAPLQRFGGEIGERAAQIAGGAARRRQPQVAEMHAALRVDEQVVGLDVVMDQAAAVQCLQRARHLGDQLAQGSGAEGQPRLLTVEQLRGEEQRAGRQRPGPFSDAEIVDAKQVGMLDLRQRRELETEALAGGGSIEMLERLQRQSGAVALVERQPGFGVGALPQPAQELPAAIDGVSRFFGDCQPCLHL
jgi:hypothetical protein